MLGTVTGTRPAPWLTRHQRLVTTTRSTRARRAGGRRHHGRQGWPHSVDQDQAGWRGQPTSRSTSGRAVVPGFVDLRRRLLFTGGRTRELGADGRSGDSGRIDQRRASRTATDGGSRLRSAEPPRGDPGTGQGHGRGQRAEPAHGPRRAPRCWRSFASHPGDHLPRRPRRARGVRRRPGGYVDLVTGPMLGLRALRPVDRRLLRRGAFDADQARAVLMASAAPGSEGGCTPTSSATVPACSSPTSSVWRRSTTATYLVQRRRHRAGRPRHGRHLLPGVEFSTRSPSPTPGASRRRGVRHARQRLRPGVLLHLLDAVCLALAVREMGLTPAEALTASTLGGARALHRGDVGHLRVGRAPTWSRWPRRRTSTSRTDPGSPSPRRSASHPRVETVGLAFR